MHTRHVLPLVLVALGVASSAADAAVTLWTSLVVRVYDATGEPAAHRRAALDAAASIVSAASVEIEWVECEPGQKAKGKVGCNTPRRPGELLLRIVRSPLPGGYREDMPLGDAFINVQKGTGVLATVYADRVMWIAMQTGTDHRLLLGRAIAHELGHLLMATNAHGSNGLMRAVWSRSELLRRRSDDWKLADADVAAIRVRHEVCSH